LIAGTLFAQRSNNAHHPILQPWSLPTKGWRDLIIGASAMQSVLLQKSYSLDEFARLNDIALTRVPAKSDPVALSHARSAVARSLRPKMRMTGAIACQKCSRRYPHDPANMSEKDIPAVFRWETPWRPTEIEELQANLGLRSGRTRDINIVMGFVLGQALKTYRAIQNDGFRIHEIHIGIAILVANNISQCGLPTQASSRPSINWAGPALSSTGRVHPAISANNRASALRPIYIASIRSDPYRSSVRRGKELFFAMATADWRPTKTRVTQTDGASRYWRSMRYCRQHPSSLMAN
jgi:hypothetical protein